MTHLSECNPVRSQKAPVYKTCGMFIIHTTQAAYDILPNLICIVVFTFLPLLTVTYIFVKALASKTGLYEIPQRFALAPAMSYMAFFSHVITYYVTKNTPQKVVIITVNHEPTCTAYHHQLFLFCMETHNTQMKKILHLMVFSLSFPILVFLTSTLFERFSSLCYRVCPVFCSPRGV